MKTQKKNGLGPTLCGILDYFLNSYVRFKINEYTPSKLTLALTV